MNRDRAYIRYRRNKAISRKKRISREVYGFDWYPHDGQYSKGKIHCGCKMCAYSKVYKLSTTKDDIDAERVKSAIKDYYTYGV